MAITDPFVLPSDVVLMPAVELPDSIREKVDFKEGDFAITRPHVRTPSKIVDAHAAELLKEFQTAKTIVEAIISYSQTKQADPHQALEEALPLLKNFVDSRLLVPPDSLEARPIMPTFSEGDVFKEFEIRDAIQILEDTELYQARYAREPETVVALKILRDAERDDLRESIEREAAVLEHLDGKVSPRLIKTGLIDSKPYLGMEWIYGVPIPMLGDELRQAANGPEAPEASEARLRLQSLAVELLEAYAHLHEKGVIHGDVHPNNLLADDTGKIKILDFGLARFLDETHRHSTAPRGGVGFYFEPECVEAMLTGQHEPPPSSELGEQYAVAVIAYQLFTGANHINFSLRNEEMLRQIVEEEPLPFSAHGVPPAPEIEKVLARALSKSPHDRFASLREFAETLRKAQFAEVPAESQISGQADAVGSRWQSKTDGSDARPQLNESFIQTTLGRLLAEGELFHSEIGDGHLLPTCSANYGVAGIAYGLLRLACNRDAPQMLSLADVWITKALSESARDNAFYNVKLELTPENVSEVSVHHMRGGVHFVQALVSHALGDSLTEQLAIEAFIEASQAETDNLDLTLGQSSVLQGCALLLENARAGRFLNLEPLLQFGDRVMHRIWARVAEFGSVSKSHEMSYLGMAHGWAGLLYAALSWSRISAAVTGKEITEVMPKEVERRLSELAQAAHSVGRGMVWPWQNETAGDIGAGNNGIVPGWCNGSAGHVFLWTLAGQIFSRPEFSNLARKAAWGMLEQPIHFNNICCGAGGCAYALLDLYRFTDDQQWLTRARQLGHRAATTKEPPSEHVTDGNSLFKGDIGLMVLLDDLAHPATARMPLVQ